MKFLLILVYLSFFLGCRKDSTLSDFKSDGCSLFPDSSLITNEDWCVCCYEHDLTYWQGGTKAERLAADEALKRCVLSKTGNKELAEIMFLGVRLGGSPYFYTWYRWGYGWGYDRLYEPLTDKEKSQVAEKLLVLEREETVSPCR